MKHKGALIEKGPVDWQILQQMDGKADISLKGRYEMPEEAFQPCVYVRVVREDNGAVIRWWTPANMNGKRWSIELKGIPAGGLYRLETCVGEETNPAFEWACRGDMIHHLGVGDLYVIAGQSNAAGYGKDAVYDAPEIGIHLLKNNGCWDLATHPMNDSTDTIHEANYENSNSGTSPYLSFGKYLKRELHYPIGFLQTSLGGSPLEAWNPHEEGSLYRNMMEVIHSQGDNIKGVLWYQGCSDTNEECSNNYLERFHNMVSSVRSQLQDEIPYLTVQLNRLTDPDLLAGDIPSLDRAWGQLREAQRQAAAQIPKVFVVPSTDCGLSDIIHNSSVGNIVLGERLAVSALRHIYGRDVGYDAPNLETIVRMSEKSLRLEFSQVGDRLCNRGLPVEALAISVFNSKNEQIKIVDYSIEQNYMDIELAKEVADDCFVCGASERNPSSGIPYDTASYMPILSFYGVSISS